jgi:hypothetical protein
MKIKDKFEKKIIDIMDIIHKTQKAKEHMKVSEDMTFE